MAGADSNPSGLILEPPLHQLAMSLFTALSSQLSEMHAWQPRHLNLWQDLSIYLGLRWIVRVKQHKRNWFLLVPRDTVLALWAQIMLSVPPCTMRPKDILLDPDSPCRSKLLAGGPATASRWLTVANLPQLPFYPIDVNVVITTTTPCYRHQGRPEEISLTCILPFFF